MSAYIEWRDLANVVVVGLVVGAGLPALFALGVRALAGAGSQGADTRSSPFRVAAAVACFAVVVGAVVFAIVLIGIGSSKH
jgi:hypothetical protein